jgi:hypothetical protein
MKTILLTFLLLPLPCQDMLLAQQPAPPPAEAAAAPTSAQPPAPHNKRAIPGFLILGTVFNQDSLAFPGATIRVRRKGDKKYRWETLTNSRGEFAVRVSEGSDYEVLIRAKGFQDQLQQVRTDIGDTQQRLSVRLALLHPEPTGAKP